MHPSSSQKLWKLWRMATHYGIFDHISQLRLYPVIIRRVKVCSALINITAASWWGLGIQQTPVLHRQTFHTFYTIQITTGIQAHYHKYPGHPSLNKITPHSSFFKWSFMCVWHIFGEVVLGCFDQEFSSKSEIDSSQCGVRNLNMILIV